MSAKPEIQGAVTGGTQSGVLAGLNAASGAARAIVQSWFGGAGAGVLGGAGLPAAGTHVTLHNTTKLDGRVVAQNTAQHMVRSNRTAHSTGRFDVADHPSPTDLVYT